MDDGKSPVYLMTVDPNPPKSKLSPASAGIATGPAITFVIVFSDGIVSRSTTIANGRPSAFLARGSNELLGTHSEIRGPLVCPTRHAVDV